jgi:hypothetical protein
MESDFIKRSLYSISGLAILAIFATGSVDSNTTHSTTSSNAPPSALSPIPTTPFTPLPTPDPKLLQVTHSTWQKGGFETVAIWRVTFWNRSDKPIGNIHYRTRYTAETGDQVDRGGVDALLGDYTVRKVIPPHQKRTIEINDGFVHSEAARGSFEIVSWEFVNPP